MSIPLCVCVRVFTYVDQSPFTGLCKIGGEWLGAFDECEWLGVHVSVCRTVKMHILVRELCLLAHQIVLINIMNNIGS